ncbi:hypothetical protein DY000_02021832 [Brassica cretica]|uniref:Uncharacterized protein n=1 Tax=Brassica cretica TaxID=69181 RepID=A0ABQ7E1K3_BRACR|nr:hypothetical protein DY000_02021832 [Brassica cretica]
MIFFIGLHVLHRSIRFLVEFGIGRRLVAWAIKLPCPYCSDVLMLGLVGMMSGLDQYDTLLTWWGLVGVRPKFDGEAGNVCVKGDASAHTPDACAAPVAILRLRPGGRNRGSSCLILLALLALLELVKVVMDSHSGLRAGLLIAFRIPDAPRGFDVVAVASCLVSALYRDFWQGTFGMFVLVACIFVQEPKGWMDFCQGTRRLGGLSSRNLMVVLTSKGTFSYIFLTRRASSNALSSCCWEDLEMLLGDGGVVGTRRTRRSFGNPEVPSDPEVVFRTRRSFGNTVVPSDHEVVFRTRRSFGNPEVPSDPEVVFRTRKSFGNAEVPSNPEVVFRNRKSFGNTEVPSDPEVVFRNRRSFGNPEVPSDPEVVFRTRRSFGNPKVPSDPEVVFRTRKSFGNLKVPSDPEVRSFGNPEVPSDPEVVFRTRRSFGNPKGPYSASLGEATTGTCWDFAIYLSASSRRRRRVVVVRSPALIVSELGGLALGILPSEYGPVYVLSVLVAVEGIIRQAGTAY